MASIYDLWDAARLALAAIAFGLAWLPRWMTWDPNDESRPDPPYVRGALVRGLTWALGAYALASWLELMIDSSDLHAYPERLFAYAAILTLALWPVLIGLAWRMAGRSDGGRRIFIASAKGLLLFVPWTSATMLSDLNRHMDRSASALVSRTVVRKQEIGGRMGTHYHLFFTRGDAGIHMGLPESLEVGGADYARASVGRQVDLTLGEGALGLKWYRRIVVK